MPLEGEAASRRALIAILVGVLLLWSFSLVGERYLYGFTLDLGSLDFPAPIHQAYIGLWLLFGLLSAAALTAGLTELAAFGTFGQRLLRAFRAGPDWAWAVVGAGLGLAIPVAIRLLVLQGAPVADDESAYQFSAELLAGGRLWVDSPPEKDFFDRQFMINNGRMYSQYFLGWPALMAPAVWLGVPGLANAFYSALTVPAVFLSARRLGGSAAARISVVLYLGSPMLMIGAATRMSHTSCLAALAWLTWCVLRSRDERPGMGVHAAVAALFCLAFFNRPLPAVGYGGPLLVWWAAGVLGRPNRRAVSLAAFLLPAVAGLSLFLLVNQLQNGAATRTAYQVGFDYAEQNGFRFTTWGHDERRGTPMDFSNLTLGLSNAGVGLLRLNAAMFGWPCSFVLALLAWRGTGVNVLWWAVASFFASHLFVRHVGMDTFGPVHFHELALAFILLSAQGVVLTKRRLQRPPAPGAPIPYHLAPGIACGVLIALSLLGYVPVQLDALRGPSAKLSAALEAPRRSGLANAIVFAPTPFSPPHCTGKPTRHWVFFRPNNDPALANDVLWVNHIGPAVNPRLLRRFPARQAWVLTWQRCVPTLVRWQEYLASASSYTPGLVLRQPGRPRARPSP